MCLIKGQIRWVALGVICLAGAFLRYAELGEESIWYDEMTSIQRASSPWGGMFSHRNDPHPPLYFVILGGWVRLLGDSPAAVRSLSAMFGILCIPATFLLARRLFDENTALIASLVVAVSQFQIWYSQEARMYSMLTLLSVLSLYLFLHLLRTWSRKIVLLYLVCAVALVYTHIYGFFILFAETLWLLIKGGRGVWGKWVVMQAAVLLCAAPWIPNIYGQACLVSGRYWITPPNHGTFFYVFTEYIGGQKSKAVLFAILTALGLFSFTRTRGSLDWRQAIRSLSELGWEVRLSCPESVLFIVIWACSLSVVPIVLSLIVSPIFVVRYSIAASVALYILVSRSALASKSRYWLALVLLLLLLSTMPSLTVYYKEDQKTQWKEAVDIVLKNATGQEIVLAYPPFLVNVLRYNFGETSIKLLPLGQETEMVWSQREFFDEPTIRIDEIADLLSDGRTFWVIVGWGGPDDPRELLSEIAVTESQHHLLNLEVIHYIAR